MKAATLTDDNKPPVPMSDEEIRRATLGELKRLDGPVIIVKYNPEWPEMFAREVKRIRTVLGTRAIQIEHVGSTSVPGLVAKPVIDILLVVRDSSDEASYVPPLEAAGYVLRLREPEWHQHRLFKGPDTNINLHVFTQESGEIDKMLTFRDWLRENREDRDLYALTKQRLASRKWRYTQNYADAKTEVVRAILARAQSSRVRT